MIPDSRKGTRKRLGNSSVSISMPITGSIVNHKNNEQQKETIRLIIRRSSSSLPVYVNVHVSLELLFSPPALLSFFTLTTCFRSFRCPMFCLPVRVGLHEITHSPKHRMQCPTEEDN